MKNLLLLISLTLYSLLIAETKKPNILFIIADDMSYSTVPNPEVITPNIDRLIKSGSSFTRSYNMGAWNGAVCMASRSMLNTGTFLHKAESAVTRVPQWAEFMKQAGYTTYFTGKWHIQTPPKFDHVADKKPGMPNLYPPVKELFKYGFYVGDMDNIHEGYNRPLNPQHYAKGWKPWDKSRQGFWQGGDHWSNVIKDNTLEFLDNSKKDEAPFFMYVAFNAPHDPRQVPKKYIDMYPLDSISLPKNAFAQYPYRDAIGSSWLLRDEFLAPLPRTEYSVKVNLQEYYALITHMDERIGEILDKLEASGQAENTIIIFTADHGLGMGQHGFMGKQNMYEHSMRVPFVISGPGIPQNKKIATPSYIQDIMPTSLDYAGAKIPSHVQFKSFRPILEGSKKALYDSIYGSYITHQRMIIKDNWKLMAYPYIQKFRLYNLANDPLEMNNLSDDPSLAEKLKEMLKSLKSLQVDMSDKLDLDNPPPEDYESTTKQLNF